MSSKSSQTTGEGEEQERGPKGLSERYNDALVKYPLTTKGLTAGIINVFAQLTAQRLIGKPQNPGGPTAMREAIGSGVFGYFVHTPLCQWWYSIILPVIKRHVMRVLRDLGKERRSGDDGALEEDPVTANPVLATAIGVVLSSLMLDPIYFAVQIFFSGLCTGNFRTLDEAVRGTRARYVALLFSSQRVWPIIRIVNMFFLPNDLLIPANSVASYFWNTYFLFRQAMATPTPPQKSM